MRRHRVAIRVLIVVMVLAVPQTRRRRRRRVRRWNQRARCERVGLGWVGLLLQRVRRRVVRRWRLWRAVRRGWHRRVMAIVRVVVVRSVLLRLLRWQRLVVADGTVTTTPPRVAAVRVGGRVLLLHRRRPARHKEVGALITLADWLG